MNTARQAPAASLWVPAANHAGRTHTPLQCRVRKPHSLFPSDENITSPWKSALFPPLTTVQFNVFKKFGKKIHESACPWMVVNPPSW